MTLGEHVRSWPDGERVVLFHTQTGRAVLLAPETLAAIREGRAPAPVLDRLRRLHLIGAPAPLPSLVVVRHRAVLLRPDLPALWTPVPSVHTHGGRGFRMRPLSPVEHRIWREINDARTVSEIAARAAVTVDDVLTLTGTLTAPDVQALQLRDAPPHPRDASLDRLIGAPRDAHPRPADQLDATGATTLAAYHLHAVDDGSTHFDDRETTVAHVLSDPHPALGGRRYGEALYDALLARGMRAWGLTVEVGCGTGALAEAWLSRGADPARYVRVDLSPELLRTQATRVDTPAVLGDATRLPLRDGLVDLLISNEVLADLQAVPWSPGDGGEIGDIVARHGLRTHPGRAWYNLGAWRMLHEVARVLRPGGHAVLTEFGDVDEAPAEAVQLDHPEVSIHFGHLEALARDLGLEAHVVRLDALLGLDLHAPQLSRTSWHALRAMARASQVHLPARAWTPSTLEAALPWPVQGLRWVPLSDEGPGPLVTRFQALVLGKPA